MKDKGISVIVKTEKEFNWVKEYLDGVLYLNWVPQMSTTLTAIVLCYSNHQICSQGNVGDAFLQKKQDVY